MKFGYVVGTHVGPGADPGAAVREAVAEAAAAEAAGFDGVFVTEHHGQQLHYLPATTPLMYLLAQATSGLDVGSAVLLLPLAQPARVAEEMALLDHFSSGRVILGLGAGYLDTDFSYFGIPRSALGRRLDEGLDLIRHLWSGAESQFDGEFYASSDAMVFPTPLRQGGPPIWIGGRSPGGVRRAARRADVWIMDATPTLTLFEPWHQLYVSEAASAGKRPRQAILRDSWLHLGGRADREYREATLASHRSKLAAGVYAIDPAFRDRVPSSVSFEELADDRWLTGTAEEIRGRLDRFESTFGLEYVLVRFRESNVPEHEIVLEQIRAFGESIVQPCKANAANGVDGSHARS